MSHSEWINVRDALPIKDEYVLTYNPVPAACIRINWYSTTQEKWIHSDFGKITHWMPLPEFPEDE